MARGESDHPALGTLSDEAEGSRQHSVEEVVGHMADTSDTGTSQAEDTNTEQGKGIRGSIHQQDQVSAVGEGIDLVVEHLELVFLVDRAAQVGRVGEQAEGIELGEG